jgi:hypothetical protein
MITSCQVQLCKPAGAVHGVEQVLDVWKRITVLDSYGVHCAIYCQALARTILVSRNCFESIESIRRASLGLSASEAVSLHMERCGMVSGPVFSHSDPF